MDIETHLGTHGRAQTCNQADVCKHRHTRTNNLVLPDEDTHTGSQKPLKDTHRVQTGSARSTITDTHRFTDVHTPSENTQTHGHTGALTDALDTDTYPSETQTHKHTHSFVMPLLCARTLLVLGTQQYAEHGGEKQSKARKMCRLLEGGAVVEGAKRAGRGLGRYGVKVVVKMGDRGISLSA